MRRQDNERRSSFAMTRLLLKILGFWIFIDYLISFLYILTKHQDKNLVPHNTSLVNQTSGFSNLGYVFPLVALSLRALNARQNHNSSDVFLENHDPHAHLEKLNKGIHLAMTEKPFFFSGQRFRLNNKSSAVLDDFISLCREGDESEALELYQSSNISLRRADSDGVTPLGAAFWSGNLRLFDALVRELPPGEKPNYVDLAKKNFLAYGTPIRRYTSLAHLLGLKFKDSIHVRRSQIYWIFRLLTEDSITLKREDHFINGLIFSGRGFNYGEGLNPLISSACASNSILGKWFGENYYVSFLRKEYQNYYNVSLSDFNGYQKKLKDLRTEYQKIWAQDPRKEFSLSSKFLLRFSRLDFFKENNLKFFPLEDRWKNSVAALEQFCDLDNRWHRNLFVQYIMYSVLEVDRWMISQIKELKNRVLLGSGVDFVNEFEDWKNTEENIAQDISKQHRGSRYSELK